MVKPKITIRDVAEKSEVSIATVSRVLNKAPESLRLREETIRRVQRVADELGYVPNRFAQSLRSRKSRFIGLSFPTVTPLEYERFDMESKEGNALALGAMLRSMTLVCEERGYNVTLLPRFEARFEKLDRESVYPDLLDGLVYMTPGQNHTEYVEMWNAKRPVVLIGRCPVGSGVPGVDIDNVEETSRLVKMVAHAGAKNVGIILPGFARFVLAEHRLEGFRKGIEEAGLEYVPKSVSYINPVVHNIEEMIEKLFVDNPKLDGLIVAFGDFGETIVKIAGRHGKRVPEDLKLIMMGDNPRYRYSSPSLSALDIPYAEMGRVSAEQVISMIETPGETVESVVLPANVFERESSAMLENV